MTYKGTAKGKLIELEEPLPFSDGQPLNVSIEPLTEEPGETQGQRILRALREGPRVNPADVEAMMKAIEEGKIPMRFDGIFDDEKPCRREQIDEDY